MFSYVLPLASAKVYTSTLKLPLTADPGTLCNCNVVCGKIWREAEKRYDSYFYVESATPTKQK